MIDQLEVTWYPRHSHLHFDRSCRAIIRELLSRVARVALLMLIDARDAHAGGAANRFRRLVVMPNVATDLSSEASDGRKDAAGEQLAFDFRKSELDLIEPGRIGRREMQMDVRMFKQKCPDGLSLEDAISKPSADQNNATHVEDYRPASLSSDESATCLAPSAFERNLNTPVRLIDWWAGAHSPSSLKKWPENRTSRRVQQESVSVAATTRRMCCSVRPRHCCSSGCKYRAAAESFPCPS